MAKTDFKMADYNQNKNIASALRTRNHQVELEEDPINIIYGILDQIFKVLDEEDISAKQIIPWLTSRENFIAHIIKKPYNVVKKTKNYL